MNATVRNATLNDLESVYTLVCNLEGLILDKKSFETIFLKNISDPNIYYLVAETDNKVVGFISLHVQNILHHSKPTCELQELNIDPNFRCSGIGSQLMLEAEKIASKLNLEEIELTTKTYREKAQTFYHQLGYTHTHNKFVKKL